MPFSTLEDRLGGGIDFSALGTPAGGMTSELLDRYEVGTWTPVITGPTSISYDPQIGLYTRIGNIIRIKFRLIVTWTGAGHTILTGLPFTTGNTTGCTINIGYQNMDATTVPTFYSLQNSTIARAYDMAGSGAQWFAPTASGKYLVGSGTYTLQDS